MSLEDGVGHGSCRSIGAFDMLSALESCGSHLVRFGGHRMAAGLTVDAGAFKAFRAALQAHGDERLGPDDLRPRLRVDARLDLDAIRGRLVEEIRALEPFGIGNPRPVFFAGPVEIVDGPRRIKERHLKMSVRHRGRIFRAIAWRAVEREPFVLANRGALDIAFSLTREHVQRGDAHRADARRPPGAGPRRGGRGTMTPWQRRLRLGLGIFVVALATLLGVSLCKSRRPAVVAPLPTKADPTAIVESTSGGLVRALGARQDLTIEHYDKLEGYADGRTRITGGRFKILQRGGRDFSIRARVAEMKGTAPDVDVTMTGAVEMVSSDGLTVRTEQASYVNAEGLVRAPGAVQFERGRMRGTSVGLTYDKARDVLSLLDKVVIRTAPDEKGEGGADIDAGTAAFFRADKYMRFERGVKMVGRGQTIEAETAVAFLTPDETAHPDAGTAGPLERHGGSQDRRRARGHDRPRHRSHLRAGRADASALGARSATA